MASDLESIRRTKTTLLTTYKRDGTPVATRVSVAFDGDRGFFRSYDKAGKTKRLRNNPSVEVGAATFRGKRMGATGHARAVLLAGGRAQVAAKTLAHRHPRHRCGPLTVATRADLNRRVTCKQDESSGSRIHCRQLRLRFSEARGRWALGGVREARSEALARVGPE